ncbi:MAG: hypothetical protein K6U04_13950 [Armatimonadetes bacterium]|nr:hypothetical protein [Armatimonadota bacterium]
MKKITDRFWLGVISGLGGNLAKTAVEQIFVRAGYTEATAVNKAAGIFLKKGDATSPYGKAVGLIADNMIAAGLGVSCVYWLTLMGRDKYLLKGSLLGAAEWSIIYGVLSRLGATSVYPVEKPHDALICFLSHLTFGAVKMAMVANLGDKRLFHPKNLTQKLNTEETAEPGSGTPGKA